MATRSRTTTQWKEKSTSPATSNPTRTSRQPTGISTSTRNATSKPSIDKEKTKPEKPIPHYLKSTASSRNESFKSVKKNNTQEQDDQKLLRRRSFDIRQLASSSSKTQKELVSPARRESIGPVVRESKFTRTNSATPKMGLDSRNSTSSRTAKGGAAAKSQPLRSRRVKKSAAAAKSNVSPSVDEHASSKEENKESGVHEVEEKDNAEREVGVLVDDNKPGDTEAKNNEEDDEDKSSHDISTVSESENLVQPEAAASEIEETAKEEEKADEVGDVPGQETSKEEAREVEESTVFPEENAVTENVEDQKVVDDNNNEIEKSNTSEEAAGDQQKEQQGEEEQQVQEGNDDHDDHDDEKTKTKQEKAPANLVNTLKRQEQGQGKRESPPAYNDVIEETASKLLEKKNNKVKALVGAFQTVIDYESASTPK